jgi:hypothetical protein
MRGTGIETRSLNGSRLVVGWVGLATVCIPTLLHRTPSGHATVTATVTAPLATITEPPPMPHILHWHYSGAAGGHTPSRSTAFSLSLPFWQWQLADPAWTACAPSGPGGQARRADRCVRGAQAVAAWMARHASALAPVVFIEEKVLQFRSTERRDRPISNRSCSLRVLHRMTL